MSCYLCDFETFDVLGSAERRAVATAAMIPPPPAVVRETASAKESSRALRAALRAAFPATRFEVRLSRGTAYGYCSVSWEDGPTVAAVREVTGPFEGSTFDGMTDSENRTGATLPDGRRSGLRGISETRTLSDRFVGLLIRAVGDFYNVPESERPTPEDYRQGRTWDRSPISGGGHGHSWQQYIGRAAEDRTTVQPTGRASDA